MYTLESVNSVANLITAYEESHKSRLPFSNLKCVLCFQRQSFLRLYFNDSLSPYAPGAILERSLRDRFPRRLLGECLDRAKTLRRQSRSLR